MGRPLRVEYPGACHHVMARGIERRKIFLDDKDYQRLLHFMEKFSSRYNVWIYAYALMPNHFHLLLETPEANLSTFMKSLKSSYANYFNLRHKRVGHLFQGRFHANVVEKESYLLEIHRYVHLNPVRAGIVERPEEWKWSSYTEFIRARNRTPWLRRDEVLNEFSRNRSKAVERYRELVEHGLKNPPESPFSRALSQAILGGEEFKEKIKDLLKTKHVRAPRHVSEYGKITQWNRKEAEDAVSMLATHFKTDAAALKGRSRAVSWPRAVAMWFFTRNSRWSLVEIGDFFSVTNSAVCMAAHRVEAEIARNGKLGEELGGLY